MPSTNISRRPSIEAASRPRCRARALAADIGRDRERHSLAHQRSQVGIFPFFDPTVRQAGGLETPERAPRAARQSPRLPEASASSREVRRHRGLGRSPDRTDLGVHCNSRHLFLVLDVAARLEFERKLLAAGLHDAAAREHVHHVWHYVIEQALIVGDHHEARSGERSRLTPSATIFRASMSSPEVGLVEDTEPGLQYRHLQDLVALLLAAGKADIDATTQHLAIDAEPCRDLVHALKNSGIDNSTSPRFFRCALSAVRKNVIVATPGISSGY